MQNCSDTSRGPHCCCSPVRRRLLRLLHLLLQLHQLQGKEWWRRHGR